jgi:hypothetical protein
MSMCNVFMLTETIRPIYNLSVEAILPRKRYKPTDAEMLLARLTTCLEDEHGSASATRGVLRDVLCSAFEGVVAGNHARDAFDALSDEQIVKQARIVTGLLRFFVAAPGPTWSMGFKDVSLGVFRRGSDVFFRIDGSPTAAVLFQVGGILRAADAAKRLQLCECGRVFARIGRQEFCSERCQKRVYMRARRAAERQDNKLQHSKGSRHGKTRTR